VIKLLALLAAYRLLRGFVAIVLVATLALLLLSVIPHTAGQGSPAARQLQHVARPVEQLLQQTLQKAIGK
jgi:hypothetical protein